MENNIRKAVNVDWLGENFPCAQACPINTEAGRYVNLIAQGKYEEAYTIARRPNPFASICGRICNAPCEDACRRKELDAPVSIRALKRFVCERYGVESLMDIHKIGTALKQIKQKNKMVAVIGAGPAGFTAAHDLTLMGYQVTVFDAQEVTGGMLRLGIPEYRLPRNLVQMEINAILNLGVTLKLGKRLGVDFTLSDLKDNGYEAVFIATGATRSRDLMIEGVDLDGVLKGIDFLLNVNLGYNVHLDDRIIVIGGGNVAFDVARTAIRQEPIQEVATNITEALDVARTAVRFGAREVHLVCLESLAEMPATEVEINEALEENIQLHPSLGPNRIIGKNGQVIGLETVDCLSVFDENGRFNPKYAEGSEKFMEAGSVIMAIGQVPNLDFLQPSDDIEISPGNTIKVDKETLATTAPGIYAGGDVAFGPRIAIEAIADGKRAATSIDLYLSGYQEKANDTVQITVHDTFSYTQYEEFEKIPRQPVPALEIDRRIGIAQVESGFDEELAMREAKRCLRCWINTEFNGKPEMGTECILCGGCVDVCPEDCFELVRFDRLSFSDESLEYFSENESEFVIGRTADSPQKYGAVMLKDETICIRCGLCAKRCPTGCITMEGFDTIGDVSYV